MRENMEEQTSVLKLFYVIYVMVTIILWNSNNEVVLRTLANIFDGAFLRK